MLGDGSVDVEAPGEVIGGSEPPVTASSLSRYHLPFYPKTSLRNLPAIRNGDNIPLGPAVHYRHRRRGTTWQPTIAYWLGWACLLGVARNFLGTSGFLSKVVKSPEDAILLEALGLVFAGLACYAPLAASKDKAGGTARNLTTRPFYLEIDSEKGGYPVAIRRTSTCCQPCCDSPSEVTIRVLAAVFGLATAFSMAGLTKSANATFFARWQGAIQHTDVNAIQSIAELDIVKDVIFWFIAVFGVMPSQWSQYFAFNLDLWDRIQDYYESQAWRTMATSKRLRLGYATWRTRFITDAVPEAAQRLLERFKALRPDDRSLFSNVTETLTDRLEKLADTEQYASTFAIQASGSIGEYNRKLNETALMYQAVLTSIEVWLTMEAQRHELIKLCDDAIEKSDGNATIQKPYGVVLTLLEHLSSLPEDDWWNITELDAGRSPLNDPDSPLYTYIANWSVLLTRLHALVKAVEFTRAKSFPGARHTLDMTHLETVLRTATGVSGAASASSVARPAPVADPGRASEALSTAILACIESITLQLNAAKASIKTAPTDHGWFSAEDEAEFNQLLELITAALKQGSPYELKAAIRLIEKPSLWGPVYALATIVPATLAVVSNAWGVAALMDTLLGYSGVGFNTFDWIMAACACIPLIFMNVLYPLEAFEIFAVLYNHFRKFAMKVGNVDLEHTNPDLLSPIFFTIMGSFASIFFTLQALGDDSTHSGGESNPFSGWPMWAFANTVASSVLVQFFTKLPGLLKKIMPKKPTPSTPAEIGLYVQMSEYLHLLQIATHLRSQLRKRGIDFTCATIEAHIPELTATHSPFPVLKARIAELRTYIEAAERQLELSAAATSCLPFCRLSRTTRAVSFYPEEHDGEKPDHRSRAFRAAAEIAPPAVDQAHLLIRPYLGKSHASRHLAAMSPGMESSSGTPSPPREASSGASAAAPLAPPSSPRRVISEPDDLEVGDRNPIVPGSEEHDMDNFVAVVRKYQETLATAKSRQAWLVRKYNHHLNYTEVDEPKLPVAEDAAGIYAAYEAKTKLLDAYIEACQQKLGYWDLWSYAFAYCKRPTSSDFIPAGKYGAADGGHIAGASTRRRGCCGTSGEEGMPLLA